MSLLKKFAPNFIRSRYLDIQKRLHNLETSVRHLDSAVDAMLVRPRYIPGSDVGFNGQQHRKKIFSEIVGATKFDAIIETGTWLGDTTGFMRHTSGKIVHSCEINPRFAALAKMRLSGLEGVRLELKESREFLKGFRETPVAEQTVFFYLDAHWYDDLPLAAELELICCTWKNYVIMIDDFKVPDDSDYGYDNYGEGKALELALIAAAVKKYDLAVFFPSVRAREETGGKCGCVVLAPCGDVSQKLSKLSSLREWKKV